MLAAAGALSAACTTVPTRDRDAAADSGAMDSMVVVPGDDVVSTPDAQPDVEIRADAMAQPDVASMPDVAPSCPAGQMRCGGACVDTNTDANNCGACGMACASRTNSTVNCAMGRCSYTCRTGYGDCDRDASNGCETVLAANPNNCLGCGIICGSNNVCGDMGCVPCGGRQTACNNVCVYTVSDVNNCGGCGYSCPAVPAGQTATCTSSRCRYGAIGDPRRGDCDRNAANGYEVNLDADVNNCGSCGTMCTSGQRCCNGTCIANTQMCNFI